MELILNLAQKTAQLPIEFKLALAFAVLIPISWMIQTKFNKDWQQILWAYFGVLLISLAVAMGWIIA